MALMLAERTRPVETVVPELIRMKALERDLPFGVFFPLIEGRSANGAAATRALGADHRCSTNSSNALAAPRAASTGKSLLTLDQLVEHYGLSCTIVRGLNDPEVIAAARAFAPDLVLSVRFSFRFQPEFLAPARLGAINVHPGRLPDYAGLYPHFYSMLAGEPSLGCSVHQVDEGIDSGPLLAAGEVPIAQVTRLLQPTSTAISSATGWSSRSSRGWPAGDASPANPTRAVNSGSIPIRRRRNFAPFG